MLKEYLVSNGFLWGPEHSPYGVSGFMHYAPLGKAVKTNMESSFRDVFHKEGFDEIETPVLYPAEAWVASGHLQKFEGEMFQTQTSDGIEMVARSELATTIYPLFRKLLEYYKGQLPFRVYQTGIVLPSDKQTEWQVRTRQYTAHEGHIFFETKKVNVDETIEYLQNLSFELMQSVGIAKDSINFKEKLQQDKPFYAEKAFGLYTTGEKELELLGIQYRSSYDFQKHSENTGYPLRVRGEYPEVFEVSFSTDRPFIIAMEQALKNIDGRLVLQLPEHLSPIPGIIFPLKNTDLLHNYSLLIQNMIKDKGIVLPVVALGSIGQRYKRADAIGVPYAITLDERSLEDGSLTVRERDTKTQARIDFIDLQNFLSSGQNFSQTGFTRQLFEIGKNKGVVATFHNNY